MGRRKSLRHRRFLALTKMTAGRKAALVGCHKVLRRRALERDINGIMRHQRHRRSLLVHLVTSSIFLNIERV